MRRNTLLLAAVFFLAAIAPGQVRAQGVDGFWKLTYLYTGGTTEITDLVVELKTVDGKITGKVLAANIGSRKNASLQQEGSTLHIQGRPEGEFTIDFRAPIVNPLPKRWLGGYSIGKRMHPAWLTRVTEEEATRVVNDFGTGNETRTHICPPLQEAAEILGKLDKQKPKGGFGFKGPTAAQVRANLKKLAEIDEIGKKETAPYYRKTLEKFPDDPAVFVAVLGLLRSAQTNKATLDNVKSWVAAADKLSKAYGPRFEVGFAGNAVEALEGQDAYATVAVEYARRVGHALPAKASLQEQIDVLRPLARALRGAGKAEDAKGVEAQIEQLEDQLDRAYLASLPEVEAFARRKGKSDRVVILEQFTQLGSGPGDIDRACSLLLKAYKPGELAVVQYPTYGTYSNDGAVLRIGPLSCADGYARYGYFRKAFPVEVRGWNATLLNGHPKGRLGGQENYERTFAALRNFIDPLLEEDAGAKVTAKAVRKGDKIDIEVNVALPKPDEDKKLRIVLVEQSIRYPGARYTGKDGVRLHHNIARACPGGVAGKSLTEAASKHILSVDIGELRGQLAKHLEDAFLPVPPPASLLKLEHLRVVAFVQDDNTREILQAVQVDVK